MGCVVELLRTPLILKLVKQLKKVEFTVCRTLPTLWQSAIKDISPWTMQDDSIFGVADSMYDAGFYVRTKILVET